MPGSWATGPGEVNFLDAFVQGRQAFSLHIVGQVVGIDLDQLPQKRFLLCVIVATAMPAGASVGGCGSPAARMSFGASAAITAFARCSSVKAFSKSKPKVSSSAKTHSALRLQALGGVHHHRRLAPKNVGVEETTLPASTTKFKER